MTVTTDEHELVIERIGWNEALHPRQGGKFAKKGTGAGAGRPAAGDNQGLSYNGRTGAGYGRPGGDNRVHALQSQLNRLGLTDAAGKPLKLDGKLGPRTTAAIKKAQQALGMKADGVATPALLAKLTQTKGKLGKSVMVHKAGRKSVPVGHHRTHPRKAAPKKPAPAKTPPPSTSSSSGRKVTYYATATKNKRT